MLVRDKMSKHPITTTPGTTVPDAMRVMQGSKIRQLPVMDGGGKLIGIVSLVDLFRASPSPATSLSVWEIEYLLEKITVETVMTKDVITVAEDTAVEEAGRIMSDKHISGLPVMRDGELVGIITESDLFHVLLGLFGARMPGVRIMAEIPYKKGGLAKLSSAVTAVGGQFAAFGMDPDSETVTFKVMDADRKKLMDAITPLVTKILDVRET